MIAPASIPERSRTQRLDALDRANIVRAKRAKLKKDLKLGKVFFHDLLIDVPDYIEAMKVVDLMLAIPKVGRVKTNKVLYRCGVSPSRTVGGLSERQRWEIFNLMKRG